MKHSLKTGLSFGLTSGIITTLGLVVGLYAGGGSRITILGGILTIAIADAFSDALGIHVSEESDNHSSKEVWEATVFTFLAKFIIALTFGVPILLLPLFKAVIVSVLWGLFLLIVFNFYLAKQQKKNPLKVISEHLFIGLVVIIITNFIGNWISSIFNSG
jgi:vacuolar iron transporter family protein